eukprot:Rmarinus@m.2217
MRATPVLSKQVLRREINNTVNAMRKEDIIPMSSAACQNLMKTSFWKNARSFACYVNFGTELDTWALLHAGFDEGKKLYLPRTNAKDSTMKMYHARSVEDILSWEKTKWGIREPPVEDGRTTAEEDGKLDLIVVPGVAFSKSGSRLGRGKGYYDRYLHYWMNRSDAEAPVTVGIAYDTQVLSDIPMTESDVRIRYLATPTGFYDCSSAVQD